MPLHGSLKDKYRIKTPCILHVSNFEPAKNISSILKAFYKARKMGLPHTLIMVGYGPDFKKALRIAEELGLKGKVVFTGHLEEDLPKLYNISDMLIFPSLYEGFGFPLLEAMSCGTPVITSNIYAMPEIVKDSALLVNPLDIDDIARGICELAFNEDLRKELAKKGMERAKFFSWRRCAEEHMKLYEEIS